MGVTDGLISREVSLRGSSPIHTSPNWPAPSFFSIFRLDLAISQASFSQGFSGLGFRHAWLRVWQRPSECSGEEP